MDLSTTYLGLKLKNPLVPSAGPLSKDLDTMKTVEDAGASAIVMYSLFEEQITHESLELYHHTSANTESFAEATSYFPEAGDFNLGPDGYLELIRKAKESLSIPVIGSLNGVTTGGWIDYAKKLNRQALTLLSLMFISLQQTSTKQALKLNSFILTF